MILMLPMLAACSTVAPPKIVSDACLNLRNISFAQLPLAEREKPRPAQIDKGNAADTPETIDEIQVHNARYDALCPKPPVKP